MTVGRLAKFRSLSELHGIWIWVFFKMRNLSRDFGSDTRAKMKPIDPKIHAIPEVYRRLAL